MATKTFWQLTVTTNGGVAPGYFGPMQDGGTAPGQQPNNMSWGVAKTSTATPYYRARLGNSTIGAGPVSGASATSFIDSATGPVAGTGATNSTSGDSYITQNAYSGTFAAGNWSLSHNVSPSNATGRIRMRIWASVNASGASARELTSGALLFPIISAPGQSIITWAAPSITLTNEYLFFQLEWQETTAGTSNSSQVALLVAATNTSFYTTTDFSIGGGVVRNPTKFYLRR